MVENPLECFLDEQAETRRCVLDALGFSRGTAGIEDEQRCFAGQRRGGAIVRRLGHQLMPPMVAAFFHVNRFVHAIEHDAMLYGCRFSQCFIDSLFEWQGFAAPPTGIRRDLELGLRIVIAVGDGFRRETGEDHGMNRANSCASEHRDDELRDHRHVNRNDIPLLDAERLQAIGELTNFAMQIGVGEFAFVARFTFPQDRRAISASFGNMFIKGVVASVGFTIAKPLRERFVPLQSFCEWLEPMQLFAGDVRPKLDGVVLGPVPDLFILGERFDSCLGRKFRTRRKQPLFVHYIINLPAG